jgi:excisionase family DNA binding protein
VTPLLTAEDVAERLGVSKDWVWAQARAGAIPHVRLGRYRRFRAEAIEAWIVDLEASNGVTVGLGDVGRRRSYPASAGDSIE